MKIWTLIILNVKEVIIERPRVILEAAAVTSTDFFLKNLCFGRL